MYNSNNNSISPTVIQVNSRGHTEWIPQNKIVYIEADSNYCLIHLEDDTKRIASKCLKYIYDLLNPQEFLRVHRKYAINTKEIDVINFGESTIYLNNGSKVSMARSQKKNIKQWIKAG